MPNIAVFVGVFYSLDNGFYCMVLVGSQDHQHFVRFVQDDVFTDHLGDVAFFQEAIGKIFQLSFWVIILVCPEEGLFEFLFAVVGVVASIDTVGDDEELDVLEKSKVCAVGMALVAVDLVECFFKFESSAFEFDLDEG